MLTEYRKAVLCFGDSNTWGRIPGIVARYAWHERWTGLLESCLGSGYRVLEEGLRGRTFMTDDQSRPGRNGLAMLPFLLETHAPLDVVVVMLGTNDLKAQFRSSPEQVAEHAQAMLEMIKSFQPSIPQILLMSPPPIVETQDREMSTMFAGAIPASERLATVLRGVAEKLSCHFLETGKYISSDPADGIHLNGESHRRLAKVMEKLPVFCCRSAPTEV